LLLESPFAENDRGFGWEEGKRKKQITGRGGFWITIIYNTVHLYYLFSWGARSKSEAMVAEPNSERV
jgi:hypothetical protein